MPNRTTTLAAAVVFALLLPAANAYPASVASKQERIQKLNGSRISRTQIDADVRRLMKSADVPGLALALISDGRPVYVQAYGLADVAAGKPLETDTIMYGASLTKLVFAYFVMQLVDDHILDLDKPIAEYLPKPLPEYPKYADLANDPRWKVLTARILLDHSPGFPNFRFINPNGKLDFKFDPGTRYAYSGEGINLLQFVIEEGLHLDVEKEMNRRVFEALAMSRTSLTWRKDFEDNVVTGYGEDGKPTPHDRRSHARAAGSMDTTITDYAAFLSAFVRGQGLSEHSRKEILRPQLAITSGHQFPTIDDSRSPRNQAIGLSSALGSVVFEGKYGKGFYKGGHDDWTDNMAVCVAKQKRCVVLLSNSVHAEKIYPQLIDAVFGDAGTPWYWEYNP